MILFAEFRDYCSEWFFTSAVYWKSGSTSGAFPLKIFEKATSDRESKEKLKEMEVISKASLEEFKLNKEEEKEVTPRTVMAM